MIGILLLLLSMVSAILIVFRVVWLMRWHHSAFRVGHINDLEGFLNQSTGRYELPPDRYVFNGGLMDFGEKGLDLVGGDDTWHHLEGLCIATVASPAIQITAGSARFDRNTQSH